MTTLQRRETQLTTVVRTLFMTRTAGIWSPSGRSASRLRELLSSSTRRVTLGSGCTICTGHGQSVEHCTGSNQDKRGASSCCSGTRLHNWPLRRFVPGATYARRLQTPQPTGSEQNVAWRKSWGKHVNSAAEPERRLNMGQSSLFAACT